MGKTIDFDAFRAEQKREPIHLTIGGKTYDLPASLPANLALDIVRMRADGDDQVVPPEKLIELGGGLFGGEDAFRLVMVEAGVALDELPDLIRLVVEAYTEGGEPDPTTPESPAA